MFLVWFRVAREILPYTEIRDERSAHTYIVIWYATTHDNKTHVHYEETNALWTFEIVLMCSY